MADHQALNRKNASVLLRGTDKLGQPVGLRKGVVVEEHHILPFCPADSLVHRIGKTGIVAVLNQDEIVPITVATGLVQALVGGTVVHHDQLKILLRLGVDGLN